MNQPESLAELLSRLRQEAGLSLRQLEQASSVERAKLSRLEHGQYKRAEPSTLTRLARALDVEPNLLLSAAGYTATEAEALPSIRPYLRTKYGHLSGRGQAAVATMSA